MIKLSEAQKGISLYLAILIMGILLAMALGLSTLSFFQIQMVKGMGDSVSAFYAADTGIERELYEKNATGTPPYVGTLDDRYYEIRILEPGEGDCPLEVNFCVQSVGIFKNTRRAIRITR